MPDHHRSVSPYKCIPVSPAISPEKPLSIIFYSSDSNSDSVLKALQSKIPQHPIYDFEHSTGDQRRSAKYAICWNPPADFFDDMPALQAIFSIAAGVDHLLNHSGLPVGVPLSRLQNAGMSEKMAEYVLYGVLHYQRSMEIYRSKQNDGLWDKEDRERHAGDIQVGMLGIGAIGSVVANRLIANGYSVSAWSRSEKKIDGIKTCSGLEQLFKFVAGIDVVVCLLPLTEETQQIINAEFLQNMKPGAFLVNAGRGKHVETAALIDALNSGRLSGALLDVTDPEPLPRDHAPWQVPGVMITPHVAAPTQKNASIKQISENINRADRGEALSGLVKTEGY